jgi:hypothetical protein
MASLNVLPEPFEVGREETALPTLRDHLAMLQRDLSGIVVGVETLADRLSRVGRPPVLRRPGVRDGWSSVKTDLAAGRLPKADAARTLGVSRRSVDRLLATNEAADLSA